MQWICVRKWTIFGRQSSVDECCHCCEFQEVNSTEYCAEHECCVLCEYCADRIVLCSTHKCFIAALTLLALCYFNTRVKFSPVSFIRAQHLAIFGRWTAYL